MVDTKPLDIALTYLHQYLSHTYPHDQQLFSVYVENVNMARSTEFFRITIMKEELRYRSNRRWWQFWRPKKLYDKSDD